MNIKSLVNNLQNVVALNQATKTQNAQSTSSDRDADGRQSREETKDQTPLSEAEMADLEKAVAEWPGVKEGILSFKFSEVEGHKILLISDPLGKVVKRIPSSEFRTLLNNKIQTTGRLLNKAM